MIFMICIILIQQNKMKIQAEEICGSRGEKCYSFFFVVVGFWFSFEKSTLP